jgi:hypothetical protein
LLRPFVFSMLDDNDGKVVEHLRQSWDIVQNPEGGKK